MISRKVPVCEMRTFGDPRGTPFVASGPASPGGPPETKTSQGARRRRTALPWPVLLSRLARTRQPNIWRAGLHLWAAKSTGVTYIYDGGHGTSRTVLACGRYEHRQADREDRTRACGAPGRSSGCGVCGVARSDRISSNEYCLDRAAWQNGAFPHLHRMHRIPSWRWRADAMLHASNAQR